MNLYREALTHFFGGSESVNRPVEVFSGARIVGVQHLNMLNEDTAFALTMLHKGSAGMRQHINLLLDHTRLRQIQWINLNRHRVEFVTLASRKNRII